MRNPQLDNEKDLLLLASKSDAAAFTAIFHHYKHKLYGYVFRLTESSQLTEDIIQDVFMKLWKDHELLASVDNFGGYLFKMSKNHVVNHFKRMAHETLIMAEIFHYLPTEHNNTQETIAVNEVQRMLSEIVEKLPTQQKAVYILSREEGLSHEEIANILAISTNTVKNHIVQAMATIRTQLRLHANMILILVTTLSVK